MRWRHWVVPCGVLHVFASVEPAAAQTFSESLALEAKGSSVNVFGASRAFETEIVPNLAADGDGVLRLEANNLFDALRVARPCPAGADLFGECGGYEYVWVPVDIVTSTLSVGYRSGDWGLFLTASGTATDDNTTERVSGRLGSNVAALYFGPGAAFAGGEGTNELDQPTGDFIAGVSRDFDGFSARLGYVGSKGLFTNLEVESVRAMLTAVVTDSFEQAAYLMLGTRMLPLAQDAVESIGYTSLYARKVQWLAPVSNAGNPSAADLRQLGSVDVYTAHLEQLGITGWLDAFLSARLSPSPNLWEARVGLHSPGFFAGMTEAKGAADIIDFSQPLFRGAAFSAGILNVPDQWYYGIEGGPRPSASAEWRGAFYRLGVSYNDPELLSVLPFAVGSWHLYWALGMGSADQRALEKD